MALTRKEKQKIIEELKKETDRQKIMIFVDFKGVKVKDLFRLRKELKKENSRFFVSKKTLMKMAFKERGIEIRKDQLNGQPAIVFGFGDEITPAKIVFQFSQKNKNLRILGGYLENEFKGAEQIIALAKLPTKEDLLARLVGSISSPIPNFLNVLQGNIKKLVYALYQITQNA